MSRPARSTPRAASATLAQVKALADPLRYQVFESLLAQPRSAKQMAEHLGTHPTRLYHHFRVLEQAGLIRPAGTQQKRGTTEKYFAAAVDRIEAPGATSPLAAALLEGVLGSTLADIARARKDRRTKPHDTYLKRYLFRATPARVAEIRARLDALGKMCESSSASDDARQFGLTLAFHAVRDTRSGRKGR